MRKVNSPRRPSPARQTPVINTELLEEEAVDNAVLTTKKRDDLSDSDFALPGRRYPIHDRAHARAALSRVSQFGSPEEKAKVRAAVHRKFPDMGKGDDEPKHNSELITNSDLVSINNSMRPSIRHERLEGREYLVVPTVMITEGVHNGSAGPLYYPADELRKTPAVWNHKPAVIYHPIANGSPAVACDPVVISRRKVGLLFNTRYEPGKGKVPGRLVAEAWLDPEALQRVDNRVLNNIQNGKMTEVSTGLFTDQEMKDGVWNGEAYTAVARNYRPDHLAILPDEIGSCSIADGAGLLRNAEKENNEKVQSASHGEIHLGLQQAIKKRKTLPTGLPMGQGPAEPYVQDIYPTFCIYQHGDKLFSQDYTSEGGSVKLQGGPQEVSRKMTYQTKAGKVLNTSSTGAKTMDRSEVTDYLIDNTSFDEDDRDFLNGLSEERFDRIAANAGMKKSASGDDYIGGEGHEGDEDDNSETIKDAKGQVAPKKRGKKVGVDTDNARAKDDDGDDDEDKYDKERGKDKGKKKGDKGDADGGVANTAGLDPELVGLLKRPEARDLLVNGLKQGARYKSGLIGKITANTANRFKKEALAGMSIETLENLAALAGNGGNGAAKETPQDGYNNLLANFSGAGLDVANGGGIPADEVPEALALPVLNFRRVNGGEQQPARSNGRN